MKKSVLLIIISAFYCSFTIAQNSGIRNGLFNMKYSNLTEDNESYSMLSLGTLFGISYSFEDMTTYKVKNGIVMIEKKGTGMDRILPAVYAFPSITLLGKPGKSLSMIVPVNLNPSSELALGVGFSYGFNTFKNSAEVGVALVGIWSDRITLNDAQLTSLKNQTALPIDESSVFSKNRTFSLGLGIYIIPLFK